MDGDEERLYPFIVELWPVGELNWEKLKFLPKVYVGMVQPNGNINHHFWYYQHEPKKKLILDELIDITIKNKQS
jgi:hypothetical protein